MISLDINAIERLSALEGIDAAELCSSPSEGVYVDPVKLSRALWRACCRQADGRGIDESQFGAGVAGDALEAAAIALLLAVQDFLPFANASERSGDDAPSRPLNTELILETADELGGIIGIDPGPLSLRRLYRMAEAKQRHDWSVGCEIAAAIYNTSLGDGDDPIEADALNPFSKANRHRTAEHQAAVIDQAKSIWKTHCA